MQLIAQKRYFAWLFVFLLVFAQHQALVHPYVHLNHPQENVAVVNVAALSDDQNNNQISFHTDACAKCLSLASLHSALDVQAIIIHALEGQLVHITALSKPHYSALYLYYQSRAPPVFAS